MHMHIFTERKLQMCIFWQKKFPQNHRVCHTQFGLLCDYLLFSAVPTSWCKSNVLINRDDLTVDVIIKHQETANTELYDFAVSSLQNINAATIYLGGDTKK